MTWLKDDQWGHRGCGAQLHSLLTQHAVCISTNYGDTISQKLRSPAALQPELGRYNISEWSWILFLLFSLTNTVHPPREDDGGGLRDPSSHNTRQLLVASRLLKVNVILTFQSLGLIASFTLTVTACIRGKDLLWTFSVFRFTAPERRSHTASVFVSVIYLEPPALMNPLRKRLCGFLFSVSLSLCATYAGERW